jgi:hypothetical protein
LHRELWVSLASLIRSYAAVHGIHNNSHAIIEATDEKITARHGEKCLTLLRNDQSVTWMRENGHVGTLELTQDGSVRGTSGEEAMDLVAEQWARELMQ